MNTGGSNKLDPNHPYSALDLTIATTNIADNIEWNNKGDTIGLDHYPIFMTCNQRKMEDENSPNVIYPTTKWNTNNTGWIQYATLTENYFRQIPSRETDVNRKYDNLIQVINKAAAMAIPE